MFWLFFFALLLLAQTKKKATFENAQRFLYHNSDAMAILTSYQLSQTLTGQ